MSEILTWDSISVSIRKLIEEIFAKDWKQKRQQLGDVLSSSKLLRALLDLKDIFSLDLEVLCCVKCATEVY